MKPRTLLPLLLGALLCACGGGGAGAPAGGGDSGTPAGDPKDCNQLFAQRVEPRLDFCRNCHVPGGVGDVTDGSKYMLSRDSGQDYANLHASWERLGSNGEGKSRILRMASGTDTRSHSGGAPWPAGSDAYKDMDAMLTGFVDPQACLIGGGPPVPDLPLLGSKRARHVWMSWCEGDGTPANPAKPDSAPLPPDPRTLVRPGINAGKAVYYNAWWEDCHVNLPESEQAPRTCGDFRQRADRGRSFLLDELPAEPPVSAAAFNNSWKKWGLGARPADFDAMYRLRYGLNEAPFHNPYPKPGEDPRLTDGGSGELPLGLRQLKDADGQWTGQIAQAACYACHGGQIGEPDQVGLANLGLGNANYDFTMVSHDGSPLAGTPIDPPIAIPGLDIGSVFNIGVTQRGENNAVGAFELLVALLDADSLGFNPNVAKIGALGGPGSGLDIATQPLTETQNTPAWWNTGSRPRKFFDAGVSNNSTRIDMAAGIKSAQQLLTVDGKPYRERIEQYDQDVDAFLLTLTSPAWPGPIDTALAEQGAILFHSKNLWEPSLHNPVEKPAGGNGSCASCHGAYSPKYVNDPAYLDRPELEGVAAHIAAVDMIGTDRRRSDMLSPSLRVAWDKTYWGYQDGLPGWVAPEEKDPITEAADDLSPSRVVGVCGWEKEVVGYLAPPLYGAWATAPYFHNGSVPTLAQVLDSSKRPPIWRRALRTIGPVTGFDQRMETAYDYERVGWKHDVLACADLPGTPLLNCNPVDPTAPTLTQLVGTIVASGNLLSVIVPDPSPGAIDKRLVYDTRKLGNSKAGHEFTDVLTDQERRAIIEYLKTL